MKEKVSVLTLDNGKEYAVLEKIINNNHNYLILFEENNPKNVVIAELYEGKDPYIELNLEDEIIKEVLQIFVEKHPEYKE